MALALFAERQRNGHDRAAAVGVGDVKFAAGPDVGNPTGWPGGGQFTAVTQSVDACINAADGYFIFDMVHVRMYDYWDALRLGVDNYLKKLNQ